MRNECQKVCNRQLKIKSGFFFFFFFCFPPPPPPPNRHVAYAITNVTTVVRIETELSLLPRADASHIYTCVLGCYVASTVIYHYPNLPEGADRIGGQLRGDKECPFSGVINSARVWRKDPESDARRVPLIAIPVNCPLECPSCTRLGWWAVPWMWRASAAHERSVMTSVYCCTRRQASRSVATTSSPARGPRVTYFRARKLEVNTNTVVHCRWK